MQKLKSFAWLLAPVSVSCSAVAGATFDRMNTDGANTTAAGLASVVGFFAAVIGIGLLRWLARQGSKPAAPPALSDHQRALAAIADEVHDALISGDTETARRKCQAIDVLKGGAK